jgi:hypothetical protein
MDKEASSDHAGLFNVVKQLHTLPVLHFNCCLTTEYSETTAHFNGNFDTDNQIYILSAKRTTIFRMHCICGCGYQVCTSVNICANVSGGHNLVDRFLNIMILWKLTGFDCLKFASC